MGFDLMVPESGQDFDYPKMTADPDMMEQVAYNLVDNAFKYSYLGTTVKVDCRANRNEHTYDFTVVNYGENISNDAYQRLREYGFRADSNRSSIEGCGMGLWYCNRLLATQDGKLKIDRKEISRFNVQCLMIYSKMDDDQKKDVLDHIKPEEQESFAQNAQDAIKLLMDKGIWSTFRPERIPVKTDNPFTPKYLGNAMFIGTSRYTFAAKLPL
jgi:signal transduction histidine kinase